MSKIVFPYINLSEEGEENWLMRICGRFHNAGLAHMGYPTTRPLKSKEESVPDCIRRIYPDDSSQGGNFISEFFRAN
jgi:hypothetical protein